jgi:hypothetical protein
MRRIFRIFCFALLLGWASVAGAAPPAGADGDGVQGEAPRAGADENPLLRWIERIFDAAADGWNATTTSTDSSGGSGNDDGPSMDPNGAA